MHCQSLKEPAVWRMGLWCSVLLVCLFLLPNLSVHPVTWVRPLLDVPGIVHCLHVAVGTVYWWLNAPLGLWQIIGDAVGADESVRLRVHTHTHTHASNKYMRMCISLFTSTSLPPPLSHTHTHSIHWSPEIPCYRKSLTLNMEAVPCHYREFQLIHTPSSYYVVV